MNQNESPQPIFKNFSIFSIFDNLSRGINFSVNRKEKTHSYLGCAGSAIIYIFVISCILFNGKHYLKRETSLFSEEKSLRESDVLNLTDYTIIDQLFFVINLRYIDLEKYKFNLNMQILLGDNIYGTLQKYKPDDATQDCNKFLERMKHLDGDASSQFFCFYLSNSSFEHIVKLRDSFREKKLSIKLEKINKDVNEDENSESEIYLDLYYPIIIFNPNDIENPLKTKYKKVTEVIFNNNIPYRDLKVSNYELKEDLGYVLQDYNYINKKGIGETQIRTIYNDNNFKNEKKFNPEIIYFLDISIGKNVHNFKRSYQKLQQIISQAITLFFFLTFIAKILFYFPLNFIHKIYLCNLVATVVDSKEKPKKTTTRYGTNNINKIEEDFVEYKSDLKKTIDKISKLKKKPLRVLNLKDNKNIMNNNTTLKDNIETKENNLQIELGTNLNYKNKIISNNQGSLPHLKILNSTNNKNNINPLIIPISKFSSLTSNIVKRSQYFNPTPMFTPSQMNKRKSVDLLSFQIQSQNNFGTNLDTSNAVPLKNLNAKTNLTNNFSKIESENNDEQIHKSKTLLESPIIKNKKINKKFSFSCYEILRKMLCLDVKIGEKAKWNLYNLLDEYIIDKLDIVSYFNLINQLRLIKSLIFNPQLNIAVNRLSHPHIVLKDFENLTIKDNEILRQNSINIRNAFNILTHEKMEKEMNLMTDYFAKNVYDGSMDNFNNTILFNMDEETSNLVNQRLKLMYYDLIEGKVPEFTENLEKEL